MACGSAYGDEAGRFSPPRSTSLAARIVEAALTEHGEFNGHRINADNDVYKPVLSESEAASLRDPWTDLVDAAWTGRIALRHVWECWLTLDRHGLGEAMARKPVPVNSLLEDPDAAALAAETRLGDLLAGVSSMRPSLLFGSDQRMERFIATCQVTVLPRFSARLSAPCHPVLPSATDSSPCNGVAACVASEMLPAVPMTVCTRPDAASAPACAFILNCQSLLFFDWRISRSRFQSFFLVEGGGAINVASTMVPSRIITSELANLL